MIFLKFLSIGFPFYICLSFIAIFILNSGTKLPSVLDQTLQLLGMSVIIFTLPFTPLLKSLDMYVINYWSFATTSGIILSAIIWEVIFILAFLIIRKLRNNGVKI